MDMDVPPAESFPPTGLRHVLAVLGVVWAVFLMGLFVYILFLRTISIPFYCC